MPDIPTYYRYWGKAEKNGSNYHLLPYHCLDVAAVGYVLLETNSAYRTFFLDQTGLAEEQLIQWSTLFLALHDIGKFADSFQNLNPIALNTLQNRSSKRQYVLRHDSLGWILWKKHIRQRFQEEGIIPQPAGSRRRQAVDIPIDFWMAAMVGHHGQPPKQASSRLVWDDFNEQADFEAASTFTKDLLPILVGSDVVFPSCTLESIQFASWWLSGLCVLSDWLGSNSQFFPYQSAQEPLGAYWEKAKHNATKAIQASGLQNRSPSVSLRLVDLINVKGGMPPEPTPLQNAVGQLEISDGPQIFILEDVTGAGKTEAAVLLAHRFMNAGLGSSLYFALPTMATANTMYNRMRTAYRKLFATDASPSLILAHGAANMSQEFQQSIIGNYPESQGEYVAGEQSAEAHCNAWLADNRKKALLADIGIGTIDQALLAILPSRHQSLRLLGLVNKILVIDEVHACDAYMHELLCTLLRAHAAAGGSAILLSATLPYDQRQALLNAYAEGRRRQSTALQATGDDAYPLITSLDSQRLREQVIETRDSVKREVKTVFVHTQETIDSLLAENVSNGQCTCWIRNTVKDAINAYQRITQEHPDWQIDLFHARFALVDRIDIENRVVKRFDKNSMAEQRQGQILIATQVVEQSLDLDFDTLISDLAPIDLLIQRAGRLRRHTRDSQGNPIVGKDQRGDASLYIYSPELDSSPPLDWYSNFFPNAQKVYDHHGQLWLGAHLLKYNGKFRMPEDARFLIEGVYGLDAQADIPDALLSKSFESEGDERANASIARLNALKMDVGYSDASTNRWWDEAKTPTRLGDPMTMVYLAKWQDGKLLPWSNGEKHAWQLSAVSMRTYWITAESSTPDFSQEAIENFKADHLPSKGRWGILLPLRRDTNGKWIGNALNEKEEMVRLSYNDKFGLMTNPNFSKDTMYESD